MQRGRFITFEGIDGAGKSSHIEACAELLRQRGRVVRLTHEPGGTPLGEALRGLLLREEMTTLTETLLFFAARAEHVARVIRPALERGEWVLSDRFSDATYAYQVGARGYPGDDYDTLERVALGGLKPDHTLLFDLDPRLAAERLACRRPDRDRFESSGEAFFGAVRRAYLCRARSDPGRFSVIDASLDLAAVRGAVLREVSSWL